MRLDNSSRANIIFAENLAGIQQSNSQSDSSSSSRNKQEQLKDRIDTIKNEGKSLRPLTRALQQVSQQLMSPMMITESMVDTNQRNERKRIMDAIKK